MTAQPVLLHGGLYEVWRTPAGGLLIRYIRTRATNPDTGETQPVDDAPEERLPEIPAAMLALAERAAASGERPSLPALVKAMFGRAAPELAAELAAQDGAPDAG